jgi:hypothetical protein
MNRGPQGRRRTLYITRCDDDRPVETIQLECRLRNGQVSSLEAPDLEGAGFRLASEIVRERREAYWTASNGSDE